MNEKYQQHHDHEPAEAPWRFTDRAQALRAAVVENNAGEPLKGPPTERDAALMLAIMSACTRAHANGESLSDDDARAAAALLSTAIEEEHGSYLEDIAEGRGLHPGSSREELRALWARPQVTAGAREVINSLGNYLLAQEYPRFAPSTPESGAGWEHRILPSADADATLAFHYKVPHGRNPSEALTQAQQRSSDMVEMLGDAGMAFLRRPSVDALAPDLLKRLSSEYFNSATHPHILFQRLQDSPNPGVGLDRQIELVHAGHMVHAFWRPQNHGQETGHGA